MDTKAAQTTMEMLAYATAYAADGPKGHFIAGRSEISSGELIDVLNPATGQVVAKVARGTAADVDRAVRAARSAFPEWRAATPAGRAQVLFAMADAVEAHGGELVGIECLNAGKPVSVARPEIGMIGDVLRFHAGAARSMTAPAPAEYVRGHMSVLQREPIGVVGAITPWNYPLLTAIFKLAGALAAGNTMVLKPSELTPLSTLRFMEIVADIVPHGVLNVVVGTGAEVGSALSAHPDVDLMSLTGSVASGQAVISASARTLKPTHLELGGKAPVVVFEDADIAGAVEAVRAAGFWNSGQECGAATRLLCAEPIVASLTEALVESVRTIKVGPPQSGDDVEMGPLISRRQRDSVEGIVARAAASGARIALGGKTLDGDGFFFSPTIVAPAATASEITTKEIFGPVVTVESFRDEADAIAKSNAVEYGLSASVWTKDLGRSLRLSSALDFGTVWVNTHLVITSEMPWGGFNASGRGRELSTLSIEDFSRTKHVMMAMGTA